MYTLISFFSVADDNAGRVPVHCRDISGQGAGVLLNEAGRDGHRLLLLLHRHHLHALLPLGAGLRGHREGAARAGGLAGGGQLHRHVSDRGERPVQEQQKHSPYHLVLRLFRAGQAGALFRADLAQYPAGAGPAAGGTASF